MLIILKTLNKTRLSHYIRPMLVVVLATLGACTGGGGDSISISTDSEGEEPVSLAVPIAYITRPIPENTNDLREPNAFNPGATLIIRKQSSSGDEDINVNEQILNIVATELNVDSNDLLIDIKDLESSFDGTQLVFAARVVPQPANANLELTTWNLWLYNLTTNVASYAISSALTRNEGFDAEGAHDIAPHFLTDDRIVFSSTRQSTTQGKLLNEGRAQLYPALDENRNVPASVLHILDPEDNADPISQISFNQSHDLDPFVRDSGEIVYSRWDRAQGNNQISLYQINPSGRNLSLLYGHNSGNSGTEGTQIHFNQVRELPDGRLAAIIRPFTSTNLGSNLVIIDSDNFTDFTQGTWQNIAATGNGHTPLNPNEIRTDNTRSPGGYYAAFYPLEDDDSTILVSWSPCRIMQESRAVPCNIAAVTENEVLAPPLFGIWRHNPNDNTQQPVILGQEGVFISEVVAATPREFPAIAQEINDINTELAASEQGMLLIDSVYDIDGTDTSPQGIANHANPSNSAFTSRRARFLRIVKPVPIADDDIFDIPNYAFGLSRNQLMREILGYTVVEPDGSAAVALPANTPFMINILDSNGRRISNRHNHWLQVAPGEVLHCTGCHTANSTLPHGRLNSQPDSSNLGATNLGSRLGFNNTNPSLFASSQGQTMAQIRLEHFPPRPLSLHPVYVDEWTDTSINTAEASIDYTYPEDWTDNDSLPVETDDIAGGAPIIVPNLDPTQESRIVINYQDHIQVIWERSRLDSTGATVTCLGCHQTTESTVAAGQLDLSGTASDLNPTERYTSYQELLRTDIKQMLDANNTVIDRVRVCTTTEIQTDAEGNPVLDDNGNPIEITLTSLENITVGRTLSTNGANSSNRFFNCFSGNGNCGRNDDPEPTLEANCEEPLGTIPVVTTGSVNHTGLLSPSELRLLSEWLDLGGQYYNNPFDTRLAP